jgi:hypothetical protein
MVNSDVKVCGERIIEGSEKVANIKNTPLRTKHTIALV